MVFSTTGDARELVVSMPKGRSVGSDVLFKTADAISQRSVGSKSVCNSSHEDFKTLAAAEEQYMLSLVVAFDCQERSMIRVEGRRVDQIICTVIQQEVAQTLVKCVEPRWQIDDWNDVLCPEKLF